MSKSLNNLLFARYASSTQNILRGMYKAGPSGESPINHNSNHIGLMYQLPKDQIINLYGTKSPFQKEVNRFYEVIDQLPLMIRQPSISTMDILEKIDYKRQENIRILLYGDRGHGKTHILTHLIHYLQVKNNHIIYHVSNPKKFSVNPSDQEESITRKGRLNTPIDAAIFLQKFKYMNKDRLSILKDTLVTTQDYRWSSKELTQKGEPLEYIIDHGINRMTHASDCIGALTRELMIAANEGKIKLATVVDNVQFLFKDIAWKLKHADHKRVYVDEITVARAIKKIITSHSKGMVTIASCDDKLTNQQNLMPQDFLGEEGWKAFDPCLPINVPKFNRKEFESYMNFLSDVGWLQRPEASTTAGRDEIRFLSGLNPLEVHQLCQSL